MLVSIIIIYFLPSCLLLPLLPATPPATPLFPYSCFFFVIPTYAAKRSHPAGAPQAEKRRGNTAF
jgi:hypothetical protein